MTTAKEIIKECDEALWDRHRNNTENLRVGQRVVYKHLISNDEVVRVANIYILDNPSFVNKHPSLVKFSMMLGGVIAGTVAGIILLALTGQSHGGGRIISGLGIATGLMSRYLADNKINSRLYKEVSAISWGLLKDMGAVVLLNNGKYVHGGQIDPYERSLGI
jgi:hypothetical protein